MPTDETLVFPSLWIGLRTKKEHVFQQVGHPLSLDRIVKVASIDSEGGCRLVTFIIFNQQYPQLVRQYEITIEPMIIADADVFDAPCETMILDMDTFNVPMTQLMIKSLKPC